jgi:hypothetical protein
MKSHQESEATADTCLLGNRTGAGPQVKKKRKTFVTHLSKVIKFNPRKITLEEEN